MSIFHVFLAIYIGLTLIAIVVGYAACMVAGRSETLRARQQKRLSRLSTGENSASNPVGAEDKKWVLGAL